MAAVVSTTRTTTHEALEALAKNAQVSEPDARSVLFHLYMLPREEREALLTQAQQEVIRALSAEKRARRVR